MTRRTWLLGLVTSALAAVSVWGTWQAVADARSAPEPVECCPPDCCPPDCCPPDCCPGCCLDGSQPSANSNGLSTEDRTEVVSSTQGCCSSGCCAK